LSIAVQAVEYSKSGSQAGGALHGVLAAVALQVFGETVDRGKVEARTFADGSRFIRPAHNEQF